MSDDPNAADQLDTIRFALVEIASEVVSADLAKNHVAPAEIPALIASVHATFAGLGLRAEPAADPKWSPPVSIRKALTDEDLISLEDGKRYRSFKRHLSPHGLTPKTYRAKWGLPAASPLTAPAYTRERSELAKSIGLGASWRKR